MKRLFVATRLLLPSSAWIISYWLVASAFLILVAVSMKATSDSTATLWGFRLVGFGSTSTQIQSTAFLEMVHPAWTILTLPFVCFIGLRSLLRSFRTDFQLFLRFSHSSCFFMETVRSLSLLVVIAIATAPLVVAILWGHLRPGLEWAEVRCGLVSCTVTVSFVATLTYLLASWGMSREIAVSLGLVTPFLMEGVSVFLERSDRLFLLNWTPPGLPYSVEAPSDPAVRVALVFFLLVVIGRLLTAGYTRWLLAE